MVEENVIRVHNYDGVRIADLSLNELNLLMRVFDELCKIDKEEFEVMVQSTDSEGIKEIFMNLIKPIDDEEYLYNVSVEVSKSLYEKLRQVSVDQAVNIMNTLFEASGFLYMFRFCFDGQQEKTHKSKPVSIENFTRLN